MPRHEYRYTEGDTFVVRCSIQGDKFSFGFWRIARRVWNPIRYGFDYSDPKQYETHHNFWLLDECDTETGLHRSTLGRIKEGLDLKRKWLRNMILRDTLRLNTDVVDRIIESGASAERVLEMLRTHFKAHADLAKEWLSSPKGTPFRIDRRGKHINWEATCEDVPANATDDQRAGE